MKFIKGDNMAFVPTSNLEESISSVISDYVEGVVPLENLLNQYQVSFDQVQELVELSDRLSARLAEVNPSAAFVESLYQDLLGKRQESRSWWRRVPVSERVQTMPKSAKIAAGIGGITITAGMVLLTARSVYRFLGMRHRHEAPTEALA
ncbi:MAG: hypothetical protein IH587_03370 [Anaerolineae bacterium]|nr:hypothetical protein [Anaerolineae bacterium]